MVVVLGVAHCAFAQLLEDVLRFVVLSLLFIETIAGVRCCCQLLAGSLRMRGVVVPWRARTRQNVLNAEVQILKQHLCHRRTNIIIPLLKQFSSSQLVVDLVLLADRLLTLAHDSVLNNLYDLPVSYRL